MISVQYFLLLVAIETTSTYGSSSCVYKFNDSTIDLSKYLQFPVKKIADVDKPNQFSYEVDLCNSVQCTNGNGCACQAGGTVHGNNNFKFNLGKLSTAQWNVISPNPLHFTVTYSDGDASDNVDGKKVKRSAVFEFQYSEVSTDHIKMLSQDKKQLIYKFKVTGHNIKAIPGGGGGGGGSTVGIIGLVIIILALVAIITYFILGGVYMYHVRGARGPEIIPNQNFWKELPLLVKDGFVFTFGPLFRLAHRRDSSYERI